MIYKKSRDGEPSDLEFDASKKTSGDSAEEPPFDPQAMEAYLKFLEKEFTDPVVYASPEELPDEPANCWPGYPFL